MIRFSFLLGASTLDPEMCGRYKLSVMVKDMAGKVNAFFNTGIVTVEVTGNTWASPDPVRLQENLPGPYPIPISQVRDASHLRMDGIVSVRLNSTYDLSGFPPINNASCSKRWACFYAARYHITIKQTPSVFLGRSKVVSCCQLLFLVPLGSS